MKQHINLIPPAQKIKLGFLSFRRMGLLSILFIVSLVVFNLTLVVWQKKIENDIQLIQSQTNQQKINLAERLREESELSENYDKTIKALEDEDRKIKGQLEAYSKISLDRISAYEVLLALSKSHIPDIWLKKITLKDVDHLEIIGETKDPAILMDLLRAWRKESVFDHKVLNILSLEKQQDAWSFRISSRQIENESTPGY
ncbi:MAG: hypothetical protein U1E78_07405 [Gammaproteobacteria bacterium]